MLLRSLNLLLLIREKLKIKEFDRQYLINTLINLISISILCFINTFKLYRNIYYSLLKIYFIFIKLSMKKRKRRFNIFSLTFESYNNKLRDIYKALKLDIVALDRDLNIKINK